MVELTLSEFKELINHNHSYDVIPMSLKGHIDVKEETDNRRIIAGYANVAVVDKHKQYIPIETLQKGIETLLSDPHYANLMLVHKNIQVGKILESYKDYSTRVDEKGLFIVCEMRKDTQVSNEVWNSILNGEYGAFSIGCEVILDHDECAGTNCVTVLDQINIFEVSVCSSPVNQESGFVILSKSEYDESVNNNVCIPCENKKKDENLMKENSEEKEVEKKTEEDSQETEEKTDNDDVYLQKLEEMQRKINALEGLVQESLKSDKEEESKKKEEDEEETEEKGAPWGSMDPKNQNTVSNPTIIDPTNYPNLSEVFDKLTSAVETLNKKLDGEQELSENEELKLAVKSRDDQIEALKKKVEILNKSEETPDEEEVAEPKTLNKSEKDVEKKLIADNPIKIRDGEVYYEEDF